MADYNSDLYTAAFEWLWDRLTGDPRRYYRLTRGEGGFYIPDTRVLEEAYNEAHNLTETPAEVCEAAADVHIQWTSHNHPY